ncbi:hypothetical protein HZH66_005259 [Vespula vulgaris]|uniref:Uncharacterized protein n=1 Tax=Vespula vulgaris TaxID=7454 RepID=A0A834NBB1_VESVU|nr:hypothetical protein HZH66_005259 [Vespula vulgaris]
MTILFETMEECKEIEEVLSGFRALPATEGREVNTELPRKVHDQCNGYNHWVVGVPTYLAMWVPTRLTEL